MRAGTTLAAALLTVSCAGQCGARGGLPPPRPPTVKGPDGKTYHLVDKGAYKAFYDAWGRLQRIEYDSNGDGRADQTALHDGRRHPHRLDVDADFDGRTDRWEQYDEEGKLLKVGTASVPGKGPDLWRSADGALAEVQVDGDRDGRIDRWQRWDQGRLVSEDLDTNGDGAADRTVRYDPRGKVVALEPLAAR